jgi:N-acetylneuraminic acid mutarotase
MTLFGWRVTRLMPALVILNACSSSDRPTAPRSRPEFAISDAVHEGGTRGFYFLPPMVAQPASSGTFDGDITTLNPAIAICDVTNDASCGPSSGTLIVFTTTSNPAISVDLTTPQYQVNWNTQAAGFVAGHTYRVHVTAGASGARRELGFADVLLTTTPGQAKFLQTGDIIVLQDGRTLPIHVRVETGIPGSLALSAATASVGSGGTDLITATVQDLHGALLAGAAVVWSVTTTPATGVADATQPLAPTSGQTGAAGTAGTTFKAGTTSGTATAAATDAGLSGTVSVAVVGGDFWVTKASMPTPRAYLGVGVVNGILYAVGGGYNNGRTFSTVEAYDPASDVWTTKAPMSAGRQGLGVAVVNGILYAVGGGNNNDLSSVATVEAFDPATNIWTTKASMPTARAGLGVAVVNGALYAIGGRIPGDNAPMATVEAYDPATDTWTTKASMPTARAGLGLVTINGLLYAVGGVWSPAVEAYDPASNTWTTKASMPVGRCCMGVAVVNGILYAVGGDELSIGLGAGTVVESYDPATDTWTTKASMPSVRDGLSAAVVNGALYAVGGYNGSAPFVATVEAYRP